MSRGWEGDRVPENIVMPKVGGYDVEQVVLVRWLKHEGDSLAAGEPLVEVESDKAIVELPSPQTGTLARIRVAAGSTVAVGTVLGVIASEGEQLPAENREDARPTASAPPDGAPARRVSPVARKLADMWRLDLTDVQGTGPDGRITRQDVERIHAGLAGRAPIPPSADPVAAAAPPRERQTIEPESQPLDKMRRVIAERMTRSATTVPHFCVVNEVDMEAALDLREQLNGTPGGIKVSITALVVRAAALALERFPVLNTSYADGRLVQHPDINIGLAVMLENGLVTPVLHQVNAKPLLELAAQAGALVERARTGHLQVGDLDGGTFTLTNLGMFDVEHFLPIINPPEAAILAVGSVRPLAVVHNGEIQARRRVKMALAVDHRVADGATAARFLQEIKSYLQAPARLLIG